jgi:hypothetical protein
LLLANGSFKSVLGGHTNTYLDPNTSLPVDYGVLGFQNMSIVTNYFARFNISLIKLPLEVPYTTKYVDLTTGKVVPVGYDFTDRIISISFSSNNGMKGIKQLLTVLKGYTQPDPTTALELLAQQLLKYPNLQSGYNLSSPVPADLLLPFSDFVTKYGIQDAAPLIMNFKAIGDVLDTPTLYIFQTLAFVNSRLSQLVDTWLLLITTTASSTQRQPKCSDPPFYTVAQ